MTPDQAAHLQYLYLEARREYVADPANGLIPYPPRPSASVPEPQPTRPTDAAAQAD